MLVLVRYLLRGASRSIREYLHFYREVYAHLWQLPTRFNLESQRFTLDLFKHVTAMAGSLILLIHVVKWLLGGWYADMMKDTPALSLILLVYVSSYVLAAVEYLTNRLYPQAKLSFTAFSNLMQLIYIIMMPPLVILSMISSAILANPKYIFWILVIFPLAATSLAFGLSAVVFRAEMLMLKLRFRETVVFQIVKIPILVVGNIGMIIVFVVAWLVWCILPAGISGFLANQAAAVWTIVSAL